MIYRISKPDKSLRGTIYLTASKSECNRVLLIHALCKERFKILNLAESRDTQMLWEILRNETLGEHSHSLQKLNVEVSYYTGAGATTMRFLIAFFATRPGIRILSGSDRMNERPIKPLVDVLNKLGAKISYLEKKGFPPLKIEGQILDGGEIEIDASVSSQFITALLLIAPTFKNGLKIRLKERVVSRSYILMTLKVLEHFGIQWSWLDDCISISAQEFKGKDYRVESDWSAASYWYEMAALAEEVDFKILGLRKNSIQGDAVVASLFQFFGVRSEFEEDGVRLIKTNYRPDNFGFDFSDYPDIVQTAAATASALNVPSVLTGLHTLRIKETDRIQALRNELRKFGVKVDDVGPTSIQVNPGGLSGIAVSHKTNSEFHLQEPESVIDTYTDHRMAMAFAPLAFLLPEIKIDNPFVVRKSYPDFWSDLRSIGFEIKEE